ncbi:MAG: ATP synthase F1 subunit gamma [Candidatus Omnitrophica bacterium]|nr:ATP synthase F1 subunit gamma [Candidatus Omnitrophota bacterium]
MAQQTSLRHIRGRITSIDSIKKVTHAMEMVAVAKMRAVEEKFNALKEYTREMEGIVSRVISGVDDECHPLLMRRHEKKRAALCVVTSDTGLCGGYNNGVFQAAERFLKKRNAADVDIIAVGRKGASFFKRKRKTVARSFVELGSLYPEKIYAELSSALTEMYASGAVDEVYIVYMKFESKSKSRAVIETYMGLDHLRSAKTLYIFEASPTATVGDLIPLYLLESMRTILYSAYSVEQSYRTVAMEEATKNAKELQEGLILLRNKVRQANITKEILEISSSAEVLR